jgi:UDP-GlcNAc:undecaprenyl-phosphate/decaprenyl-phosphate GlcNAc-1-phosphate transferase
MTKYILITGSALIIVVFIIPFVKKIAIRWGFIDIPDERKLHTKPLPRLGGIAIYLGSIIALALFDLFYLSQLISIILGATLVSFLGIWDDYRVLKPLFKLTGQITAGIVLILSGVQVSFLPYPALNIAATLLWVVGITNALNLLDNMDGLSGGVATIACTFFFLIAVMTRQYLVASLSAALLGACLGFLYYNFNPASIFMGDSGSLFIGFVLSAIGIKLRFPSNVAAVTWLIPVVVLGLPVFDTTLVVISRLRRGLNPLVSPGKDHISHRLVKMGLTQREAVLSLYLVCCALGAIAMFLIHATIPEGYFIGGLLLTVGIYVLWRFEVSLSYNKQNPA